MFLDLRRVHLSTKVPLNITHLYSLKWIYAMYICVRQACNFDHLYILTMKPSCKLGHKYYFVFRKRKIKRIFHSTNSFLKFVFIRLYFSISFTRELVIVL